MQVKIPWQSHCLVTRPLTTVPAASAVRKCADAESLPIYLPTSLPCHTAHAPSQPSSPRRHQRSMWSSVHESTVCVIPLDHQAGIRPLTPQTPTYTCTLYSRTPSSCLLIFSSSIHLHLIEPTYVRTHARTHTHTYTESIITRVNASAHHLASSSSSSSSYTSRHTATAEISIIANCHRHREGHCCHLWQRGWTTLLAFIT